MKCHEKAVSALQRSHMVATGQTRSNGIDAAKCEVLSERLSSCILIKEKTKENKNNVEIGTAIGLL